MQTEPARALTDGSEMNAPTNIGLPACGEPESSRKPGAMIAITTGPMPLWVESLPLKQHVDGIHSSRLRILPRIPSRSFSTQWAHPDWT
jgi:hypothetical protein